MALPPNPTLRQLAVDAAKVAKLLHHQLKIEKTHWMKGPRHVDAEALLAQSEEERSRTLGVLETNAPALASNMSTRENTTGMPAIPADIRTHAALERAVRTFWPERITTGEEADEPHWDRWRSCPGGTETLNLDALDGSMLFDSMSFGYGATASLYRRTETGSDELLYTVTVNSNNYALIYLAPYDAVFTQEAPFVASRFRRVAEDDLDGNARSGTVACVAAREDHRMAVGPLFATDLDWAVPRNAQGRRALTTFTLGGAPAAIGLIRGRLAALALSDRQTLHDAAPLIALAAVGISVFDDRGEAVSYADLKALYNELARPNDGELAYHPIPRLVFARDPQLGKEMATRIYLPEGPNGRGRMHAPGLWAISVTPAPRRGLRVV